MTIVSIVWQLREDQFVPVAIFTKREDADIFKRSLTGAAAITERTMSQAMDALVVARLHDLGLKLAIVEQVAA